MNGHVRDMAKDSLQELLNCCVFELQAFRKMSVETNASAAEGVNSDAAGSNGGLGSSRDLASASSSTDGTGPASGPGSSRASSIPKHESYVGTYYGVLMQELIHGQAAEAVIGSLLEICNQALSLSISTR